MATSGEQTGEANKVNSNIKQLTDEAHEILHNARLAWMNGEITDQQFDDVKRNLLLDVGFRVEVLVEPAEVG